MFADVFDALCVLAVPPLTLGCTLIEGWIVIVGCTLMIAMAFALAVARSRARLAGVVAVGVTTRVCYGRSRVVEGSTRT